MPCWRDALPGTAGSTAQCGVGEAQTPHQSSGWATASGPRVRAATAFAELVLETWDLHCDRNGQEHRTADMGCKQLVVRRGQPFTITLRFSGREYQDGVDKISFNVQTGECCHIRVAREGRGGVTTLCPCSRAHLCSHGAAPCHTVPVPHLAEAFVSQGKMVETRLLNKGGREAIKK